MTDRLLHEIMDKGEDARTAFVSQLADYGVIAASVCALANGEGGTVICGLSGAGEAPGVDATEAALLASLEDRLHHDITPTPSITVAIEQVDSRRFVVIDVSEGLDGTYMYEGRLLFRRGSQNVAANIDELRRRLQLRASQPIRWERRPASNLLLDDLDLDEILLTAQAAIKARKYGFEDRSDPTHILRELGMFDADLLTNAADVAFGRDPALRNPQCRARILRFETDKLARTGFTDRHFSGPAAQVFAEMLHVLEAAIIVRSTFPPEQSRREDRPDYAFEAVREGLLNALAHRDYASFSGGVTVSIFPRRIEIWNSGRLPSELNLKDLGRVHHSLPVNPDIARVLNYRGLMELVGRGTRLIVEESRKLGAKIPRWTDAESGVTLTIHAAPARVFGGLPLNTRQAMLIADLQPGASLSPAEYRAHFAPDVSERQARRDLKELELDGLLIREKGGASTRFRRTALRPHTDERSNP